MLVHPVRECGCDTEDKKLHIFIYSKTPNTVPTGGKQNGIV